MIAFFCAVLFTVKHYFTISRRLTATKLNFIPLYFSSRVDAAGGGRSTSSTTFYTLDRNAKAILRTFADALFR